MGVKTASEEAIVFSSGLWFAGAGKETTCRRPRSQEWMQWKQWKEAQAHLRQADQSVPCKSIAGDLPVDDVGYSAIQFAIRCWSDDWGAVGLVLDDLNNNCCRDC
jgi:hypothetical protein